MSIPPPLAGEGREGVFAFDPDAVSIAHLTIEKGRVIVAGGPGRSLLLDRLGFSGDVRSLLGPVKGEGSVAVEGESYLFSIATGRAAADGGKSPSGSRLTRAGGASSVSGNQAGDKGGQASKRAGHGKGYLYPHDYPGGWVAQQYLPDGAPSGRRYYEPTDRGAEQSIRKRLEELRRSE